MPLCHRQASFPADHHAVTRPSQHCSPLWPCLIVGTQPCPRACPSPVLLPELSSLTHSWSAPPARPPSQGGSLCSPLPHRLYVSLINIACGHPWGLVLWVPSTRV